MRYFVRPLLLAIVLSLTALAPAAQADLLGDINSLRSGVGLDPLVKSQDPLISEYVLKLFLLSGNSDNGPGVSPVDGDGCGCWSGDTSVLALYRAAGGKDNVLFWQIKKPILDTPAIWQILLDPRASSIVTWSNSQEEFAVVFDRSKEWKKPIVTKPLVDLDDPIAPAVILPPAANGRFVLEEEIGQRWFPVKVKLAAKDGLDGASLLLPWDYDSFDLAAGRRYRVTAAGSSAEFRTKPIADPLGRWKFDRSMKRSQRLKFFRALGVARPASRKLLARVAGDVLLRRETKTSTYKECDAGACAGYLIGDEAEKTGRKYFVQFDPYFFKDGPTIRRAGILHELGHVLDFSGISRQGLDRFETEFRKSTYWDKRPWWNRGISEVFADNFAYYSLGHDVDTGGGWGRCWLYPYGEVCLPSPRLMSNRTFGRMLANEWQRTRLTYGWFTKTKDPRSRRSLGVGGPLMRDSFGR